MLLGKGIYAEAEIRHENKQSKHRGLPDLLVLLCTKKHKRPAGVMRNLLGHQALA